MTSYTKIIDSDLASGALYDKVNDMADALNAGKLERAAAGVRKASTAYSLGDVVMCEYHPNLMLKCTTAGTTSSGVLDTSGSLPAGTTINDGTVVWTAVDAGGVSKVNGLSPDSEGNVNVMDLSNRISNCITEIPQDIKLELNNGTLTLKSGSKVYVPNGSGVFNSVTIASDITRTQSTGGPYLCFFYNNAIHLGPIPECYSGSTAPTLSTAVAYWYDTTNNVVKRTGDGGSTWTSGFSLPYAAVSRSGDSISSIDRVFNGFGYIGTTVFALPGVKGLIPNGRKADGTLNTTAFACTSPKVITFSTAASKRYVTFNGGSFTGGTNYYIDKEPADLVSQEATYLTKENKIVRYGSGTSPLYDLEAAYIVSFVISSGRIEEFEVPEAVSVATKEDLKNVYTGWNLLDFKWSSKLLNDIRWLRGDTFSWHYGDTYIAAYQHLVDDIQGVSASTETVGGYTITYYRAADGDKIVLPNQEDTVLNIYNATGVAWYYILDTTNQRFKLPRINPAKEVLGVNAPVSVYGNGKALGLTNGTTNYGLEGVYGNSYLSMATGAYDKAVGTGASQQGLNGAGKFGVTTDASKSGIVGQADLSNTSGVYKGNQYLYFYVGQYSQTATEQTAGLNSELFNGKVDLDLDNMNPSATSKQTIVGWGMPDYNSLISVGNTTRTPTSNVVVFCDKAGSLSSGSISFSGKTFYLNHNDSQGSQIYIYREFYIPKGTQYTTSNLSEVFEVPLIGG